MIIKAERIGDIVLVIEGLKDKHVELNLAEFIDETKPPKPEVEYFGLTPSLRPQGLIEYEGKIKFYDEDFVLNHLQWDLLGPMKIKIGDVTLVNVKIVGPAKIFGPGRARYLMIRWGCIKTDFDKGEMKHKGVLGCEHGFDLK